MSRRGEVAVLHGSGRVYTDCTRNGDRWRTVGYPPEEAS
jgi:hypothetical protein